MDASKIKLPIAVIFVIVAQAFGLIWYMAQLDSTVTGLTEDVESIQSIDLVDELSETLGELEKRLKLLVRDSAYFIEAFGDELIEKNGELHEVHRSERIARDWNKDDLIDFEEKVQKLESVKLKLDAIAKKEKPIEDRKLEYKKIDDLLFEALVEKHEEGRPEKMVEYLKLRKEIKDKHPLED